MRDESNPSTKLETVVAYYITAFFLLNGSCHGFDNPFMSVARFPTHHRRHHHHPKYRIRGDQQPSSSPHEWKSRQWDTLLPLQLTEDDDFNDNSTSFWPSDAPWKNDDVYRDLERLETAINMSNAEGNLKHLERIEMMQHFARQRRPLYPDVRDFILAPLGLSLALSILQKYPQTKIVARLVTTCLDWHFWIAVVTAPILLFIAKKKAMPPPEPMPEDMQDLAPEYWRFVQKYTDWEDPKTSCRDHVLVLLELWTSSVIGMALVGGLSRLRNFPNYPIIWLWLSCAQLLTRLGAVASIYQFPGQIYQLQRDQQPRPLSFFPTILQLLVRNVLRVAPFGMASDFSKILIHLQRGSLVALYGTFCTILVGASIRLAHSESLSSPIPKKRSFVDKLSYLVAFTVLWKKPLQNLARSVAAKSVAAQFSRIPLIATLVCLSYSCVGLVPILRYVKSLVVFQTVNFNFFNVLASLP
jgi:hypothetical protein